MIGDGDAEFLELFVVERFGDHGVEHLLLEHGVVHFAALRSGHCGGFVHPLVELHDVDFAAIDAGHCGARAEECAARGEKVTEDKRQKRYRDDHKQEN